MFGRYIQDVILLPGGLIRARQPARAIRGRDAALARDDGRVYNFLADILMFESVNGVDAGYKAGTPYFLSDRGSFLGCFRGIFIYIFRRPGFRFKYHPCKDGLFPRGNAKTAFACPIFSGCFAFLDFGFV